MTSWPDGGTLPPPLPSWVFRTERKLMDKIEGLEAQLADCQAYLHETIKAYEALEGELGTERRLASSYREAWQKSEAWITALGFGGDDEA